MNIKIQMHKFTPVVSFLSLIITVYYTYSETLYNEYIERIYQMSSGQFLNEFYTILRKFQYLRK